MLDENLIIVAIGASAGGLESFQKLLPKLPQDENISYVIIQHLDPTHPTLFGKILSKYSNLKITPIKDNEKIEGDHIYYCPPGKDVVIENSMFKLSKASRTNSPKPSINKFLSSLSKEKKDKAIAIILSGTGSDGAKGIEEIVKNGGIALTEDESAKYYFMPKAAVDTGKVLFSIPAELLAENLEDIIWDRNYFQNYIDIKELLYKIFDIISSKTGIDFSSYKETTIMRRIEKRMKDTFSKDVESYLTLLESNEEEVEKLKDEFLIIVTSFFRDKESFLELYNYLEELVKNSEDDDIRVWVPACATGEEAYSIAIILCEIIEKNDINKKITIFATDISEKIIEKARKRYFVSEQMKSLPDEYRDKYFEFDSGIYKVKKILRNKIFFSRHNIIKDPPFQNIDLISCRNLLIYFNVELQKRVLKMFYYSMKDESLLFLGKSENTTSLDSLFVAVNYKHRIYKKSDNISNIDIDYFRKNSSSILFKKYNTEHNENKALDIELNIDKAISKKYAKSGVVINSLYDIVYYKGDCSEYIKHPKGFQVSNIYSLIVDYLKLDLKVIINESTKHNTFVRSPKVRIPTDNKKYIIMEIFPLRQNSTFFISFNKFDIGKETISDRVFDSTSENTNEIYLLEEELNILKEKLQINIEELETSNEELQSTNEELHTVNDELNLRNSELEFSNEIFNNFLNSVNANFIIMDEQMNIVKYTDKITNFFDIPEENISNFSTILLNFNVKLPNLLEDIRACVKNGKNITYDVVIDDKTYIFLIRKIYVSSDKNNFIALSFFDKTDIAQKEQILFQQSKMASMGEMIGNIAHQWRQPLNVLSLQIGKVILDYKMKKLNDEIIDNFDKKSTEVIQRMSKTIDDFRNFFRPNKQKQLFKIKDALKDVLLFTKDSYVDNNITLEIEDFDENIVTNGFKNELVQVLLVILNNSKDAIKSAEMKNAKVDIKIGVDKECVSISIQDNGGGIDNDVLPKIFEPYFTTKFESNGTGIGLYMAKMIIETSMKGELKIENSKGGVLVSIKIPKDVSNV